MADHVDTDDAAKDDAPAKGRLRELADLLEGALCDALADELDGDGKVKKKDAAILNAARMYLRDNGYLADTSPQNQIGRLRRLTGAPTPRDNGEPLPKLPFAEEA